MGRAIVEEMKEEVLNNPDELSYLRELGDIYTQAYVVAEMEAYANDEDPMGL